MSSQQLVCSEHILSHNDSYFNKTAHFQLPYSFSKQVKYILGTWGCFSLSQPLLGQRWDLPWMGWQCSRGTQPHAYIYNKEQSRIIHYVVLSVALNILAYVFIFVLFICKKITEIDNLCTCVGFYEKPKQKNIFFIWNWKLENLKTDHLETQGFFNFVNIHSYIKNTF